MQNSSNHPSRSTPYELAKTVLANTVPLRTLPPSFTSLDLYGNATTPGALF